LFWYSESPDPRIEALECPVLQGNKWGNCKNRVTCIIQLCNVFIFNFSYYKADAYQNKGFWT